MNADGCAVPCTGDVEAFLDTQDILYTWFNQHLPIVYIVAEIVYLIVTCGNLTNWLLLLTSAGIGLGGINFLSVRMLYRGIELSFEYFS